MQFINDNPFQLLTFIVAPAILTNSSSVLSLSTSNRFARVVDRSRVLYDRLKSPDNLTADETGLYNRQIHLIGRRSLLLVKALTWFYVSVGAFAATTLISLLGAGVTFFHLTRASHIAMALMLACGVTGVVGLVTGAGLLVREMWLAQSFLRAEVQLTETLLKSTNPEAFV